MKEFLRNKKLDDEKNIAKLNKLNNWTTFFSSFRLLARSWNDEKNIAYINKLRYNLNNHVLFVITASI